ncbi:TIGR03013 family PEP-CTERM/XrtA system glycosyltransferase [Haliea sp. E1-2-M8]|uniref:TIGR03013 family XrtA/PEP-CTERM system glycosyltransferase n=1 Tax=Haliea sp. E1-2-M8 TaxID=3064706 RepID=UPI0027207904|nr:TIGR03013 family XrtA/PEP-CTERM system glycosyltransferase [Haliea sp. E1-2-M8]MDO8862099.1 TIGR03013 family PEP-CTERM/XrtA system glycosyltransferase [Haliea sp. E1-2-M8]
MIAGNLVGLRHLNHRVHVTYSWLVVVDAVLFFAACYLATWLYYMPRQVSLSEHLSILPYQALVFTGVTVLAMLSMGLYQPRLREGANGIFLRTVGAFMLMVSGMMAIIYLVPALQLAPAVLLYAAALAFVSSLLTRELFSNTVKQEQFNRRVLVIGTGRMANNIARKMRRTSDRHGFRICGYLRVPGETTAVESVNILTMKQCLFDYVRQQNIHQVVVALDNQHDSIPAEELLRCRMGGVSVLGILDFFEQEAGKVLVEDAPPEWFIFARGFKRQLAGRAAKRLFDLCGALFLLLLTWPVMLLTVLAIKIEDGIRAPVIFRQQRVGLNGVVFSVMKFRSMTVDAESDGKARWAAANDARVTRVGKLIRKLRIDELPQIFNVLAGNMALVGPRPERPEFVCELCREIPYFDNRHSVKPGITGWAQLNYPYGASVADARHKLEYDLYYVKNQSLYLDFMVLLQTVEVVLFGKGAH